MKNPTLSFLYSGLNCVLIRSSRKTFSLSCTPEGTVQVRGPLRATQQDARRLIDMNRRWIDARLAAVEAARGISLSTDTGIRLLGKQFTVLEGGSHAFGEDWIMIPHDADNRRKAIDKSCRLMAQKVFADRVEYYAPLVGVTPGSVKIGWGITQKWGSCDRDGNLYFTWKALFCEEHDLDYLVVHELCHILHHDHSPRFWASVSRFFPDYRACRERMSRIHAAIRAQGWVNY